MKQFLKRLGHLNTGVYCLPVAFGVGVIYFCLKLAYGEAVDSLDADTNSILSERILFDDVEDKNPSTSSAEEGETRVYT